MSTATVYSEADIGPRPMEEMPAKEGENISPHLKKLLQNCLPQQNDHQQQQSKQQQQQQTTCLS